LWRSNGTEDGTYVIKLFDERAFIDQLTNVNGLLYFTVDFPECELWRSDSTDEGTYLVKGISSPTQLSPSNFTILNGILYFSYGSNLWRSDGTDEGTFLVKSILPGSDVFGIDLIFQHSEKLFIIAQNVDNQLFELWESNGTEAGTFSIKTLSC
jgi:trimeric autotransporter adhesin